MCSVREHKGCLFILGVVDVSKERNYFRAGIGLVSNHQRNCATSARQRIVVVKILSCGQVDANTERVRRQRVLRIDFGRALLERPAIENNACPSAIAWSAQLQIGDAARGWEGIRLSGNSNAHVATTE